jgi:hypothetical protein
MGLFQDLNEGAKRRKLDLVVIGGIAVIFHGFMRDTADLDLLVRIRDRAAWLEFLLSELSYSTKAEREHFMQLDPPQAGAWPVDLMFVKDETFNQMFAAGPEEDIYGAKLKIPILEHLLALKVHALQHGHIDRHMKDRLDIEGLIRVNSIDLKAEKMRKLFLKHGSLKMYEQISRAVEN